MKNEMFMTASERMRVRRSRALEVWSLRAEGLTFYEIGVRLGVTGSRAQQMFSHASHAINTSMRRSRTWFRLEKTADV